VLQVVLKPGHNQVKRAGYGGNIRENMRESNVLKKQIIKKYEPFLKELETTFEGEAQGAVITLPIGKKIYPLSLAPQLEIILLDPDDKTICFRLASDPDAISRKKGEWKVGGVIDAVVDVINWADKMKRVAAGEKLN
jgi:hypothetical protein